MSVERIFIAKTIAHKLNTVEDTIDAALASAGDFAAGLPQARKQAGLSAVVGQDVFDAAAGVIAQLNEARSKVVELHQRLDGLRAQLGMKPIVAMGAYKPLGFQQNTPTSVAA